MIRLDAIKIRDAAPQQDQCHDSNVDRFTLDVLKHYLKPGLTLDIGCGNGAWLDLLLPCIGLDMVNHPRIIWGRAECIPFKDKSFTNVIALDSLEHTQDIFKSLSEIYRVARSRIILKIPKRDAMDNPEHSWIIEGVDAPYVIETRTHWITIDVL